MYSNRFLKRQGNLGVHTWTSEDIFSLLTVLGLKFKAEFNHVWHMKTSSSFSPYQSYDFSWWAPLTLSVLLTMLAQWSMEKKMHGTSCRLYSSAELPPYLMWLNVCRFRQEHLRWWKWRWWEGNAAIGVQNLKHASGSPRSRGVPTKTLRKDAAVTPRRVWRSAQLPSHQTLESRTRSWLMVWGWWCHGRVSGYAEHGRDQATNTSWSVRGNLATTCWLFHPLGGWSGSEYPRRLIGNTCCWCTAVCSLAHRDETGKCKRGSSVKGNSRQP